MRTANSSGARDDEVGILGSGAMVLYLDFDRGHTTPYSR